MEEFIQIFIFVSAMVISVVIQNGKNKKKTKVTSPQEVLHYMFPEIEKTQEKLQTEMKIEKIPIPNSEKKKSNRKINNQIYRYEISSPTPPIKKKERIINLNSKEEAKKAFIYSEIFKRKY